MICDCFSLTEKKIRKAIEDKGLQDVDDVYAHFKVEPCGSCMEEIERVLEEAKAEV